MAVTFGKRQTVCLRPVGLHHRHKLLTAQPLETVVGNLP